VLILEDLDRFSRTDPKIALSQFTRLLSEGVTIATLGDRPKEFLPDNEKESFSDLLQMVIEFCRSNGESRRKSGWAHKKWEKRREMAAEGRVFKMKHPTWVRFEPSHPKSQEGKYVVVPRSAKIVRGIFQQYNDGLSVYSITKRLNRRGVKTFSGKTWAASIVKYLLRSRGVLGEYQPKRIINGKREDEGDPNKSFFPAIIKESVFNRAQARWKVVPNRNGRPPADESDEILSGIIRCPYCGGSMGVQESRTKHLLACNKSFDNACVRVSVKRHFVEWCAAASTEEIYNSISLGDDNSAKIQAIEGKLVQLSKEKELLIDLVVANIAEAKNKVFKLEAESKKLSLELEAERDLDLTNEADGDAFVEAFVTNQMDRGTRLKAMLHIRRFVASVEVYFLGDRKTYDRYRADLIKAESSGPNRRRIWLKLRKKHKIEQKQFVRVLFTRPIDGETERTFTYQYYLKQMKISGVKVTGTK
jgi:hypothetical protein